MIEVGEYVRTISGNIDRVDAVIDSHRSTIHLEKHKWQDAKNILKHSKNIIDLIQEGDIIKYKNEKEYYKDEVWKINKSENIIYTTDGIEVNAKNIKTIVTHEQFANIQYRVEG